jgi:adenine-specific DNA glycosylase
VLCLPFELCREHRIEHGALSATAQARRGRFPKARAEIDQSRGIERYIDTAICLFAHKQPEPLLDLNMARAIVIAHNAITVNCATLDLAAMVSRSAEPIHKNCPLVNICAERRRRSS